MSAATPSSDGEGLSPDGEGLSSDGEEEPSLDADVVVVGCGPVGVMTALRCAQRGLSVIAVDRSREIYPLPRALAMDDEVQRLFERAGLGDAVRQHSTPLMGGEFVDAVGRRVVGIDYPPGAVGPLGLPRIVTFDQPAIERSLRAAAIEAGVDLRLGLEAFAVDEVELADAAGGGVGVRVGLGDGSADAAVTARWLVAADGAKSTIRSLCGIAMVDQGFDQMWLVVDTTLLDPELPLPHTARQVCDPARVTTFVPGPAAHRRWEFQLHPHETREQMQEESAIRKLLDAWGSDQQLRIDRAAVYRFHATVAATFRAGPVFLAGDAAHQMPPFNGQGMCTGMRDAENLSWKLAMVADGRAGDRLLDTYDAERRPHAAGQVVHSVDAGLLIQAIANDGDAALESGYGQRPFPTQSGDLYIGEHRRIGAPLPAPALPSPGPGPGWSILTDRPDMEAGDLWSDLGTEVVAVTAGAYPELVGGDRVAVVRPDHHLAATTTDLPAVAAAVALAIGRGG